MKRLIVLLSAPLLAGLFCAPAYAQKTKAQLTTEIGTTYPDNTVGAITPSGVRAYETDVLNSIMPNAPVVSGNLACFNGTTGLLQDCGVSPGTVTLTVGSTQVGSAANGQVLYVNGSTLSQYNSTQLTAQINTATASLPGAIPAWPNNTTTFFRGDGTYAGVGLNALPAGTQDTALGYWGSTAVSALAIGNCSNALTYSTSTHTFGCNVIAGTGTVTSVGSGAGLTGGAITSSGTLAALPQGTPGGRLVLQMSGGVGGIPAVDVPAATQKTIVLLPGTTSWSVPLDWTSSNTITAVGGSGGSAGSNGGGNGGPSAGGAWAQISNLTLTPGATVTVNVPNGGAAGAASGGAGGAATDTYLCNTLVTNCASIAGSAVQVGAKSGGNGTVGSGSTGGQASASVGTTKFNGGNGAVGGSTGGGGAGGAAGPSGAGGNGVAGSGTTPGAGGTADNGIVGGGSAPGGAGNVTLSATDSVTFRLVEIASGGGGANSATPPAPCVGGFGAGNSSGYGGGVAGGSNGGAGVAGCPGVIYITYTPSPTVIKYVSCATYIAYCSGPYVPYYNGTTSALGTFSAAAGGLSLTLNATDNIAGNCYEIFYFNNSGSPVIGTGPSLANCAAGSLARDATGGISLDPTGTVLSNTTASMTIKNNGSSFTCPANQCTVLGMIHTPVNGQVPLQVKPNAVVNGPNSEIGLDNYFNRVTDFARAAEGTAQWIFSGPAVNRALNNSSSNQITFLDGLGVKRVKYSFYISASPNGTYSWAYGPSIAINQTCAVGATHGAGQGILEVQAAGTLNNEGATTLTFDAPYSVAGLNVMHPCDAAINATIVLYGNDFDWYGIEGITY